MASWKEYLGDRAFYRKIIAIALPISAQQLITVGVNLMDTVMLSSMGDAQLSASALGGQFINLFQIFCMGLGMGASVLTSRYWGMQELKSLTPEKLASYAAAYRSLDENAHIFTAGNATAIQDNAELYDRILDPFA